MIYVLKLQEGKYYVGRTRYFTKRIQDHFAGKGSVWTQLYPPISILSYKESKSPFEEDKMVKELMSVHGIDNVRGGSYVQKTLTSAQRRFLQHEIDMARDVCLLCGSDEHFIRDCDVDEVVYECGVCGEQFASEEDGECHIAACTNSPKRRKKKHTALCCDMSCSIQ